MSSPLDGRIRSIAREEAAVLLGGAPADGGTDTDLVAALDLKVTELTVMVKRLEARLDAVEKAAGQADQEARSATRRTRGTSG